MAEIPDMPVNDPVSSRLNNPYTAQQRAAADAQIAPAPTQRMATAQNAGIVGGVAGSAVAGEGISFLYKALSAWMTWPDAPEMSVGAANAFGAAFIILVMWLAGFFHKAKDQA